MESFALKRHKQKRGALAVSLYVFMLFVLCKIIFYKESIMRCFTRNEKIDLRESREHEGGERREIMARANFKD